MQIFKWSQLALMLFLMAVRTIKFDFLSKWKCNMHDMPGIYIMFRRHLRYYGCFLQFYILETVSLSIRAKVENTLHSGVHFDRRNL